MHVVTHDKELDNVKIYYGCITHFVSSESSSFMAVKSTLPTPTMMMDNGRREAAMMAFLVSVISEIAPSVSMSSTKYC